MSYNVNDIVELTCTYRDSRWTGNYKNIMRYRGFSGELADETANEVILAFNDAILTRILGQLGVTTSLREIKMVNVTRPQTPAEIKQFDAGEFNGSISTSGFDVPQASACFVRQAFNRGRKSVGRLFLGPLPNHFIENGEVKGDPTGLGDLQDVIDTLGDEVSAEGYVMRPIVNGSRTGSAQANQDVRSNRVSRLVTYMRSRRLGIGE
jgi:hypothetical protein